MHRVKRSWKGVILPPPLSQDGKGVIIYPLACDLPNLLSTLLKTQVKTVDKVSTNKNKKLTQKNSIAYLSYEKNILLKRIINPVRRADLCGPPAPHATSYSKRPATRNLNKLNKIVTNSQHSWRLFTSRWKGAAERPLPYWTHAMQVYYLTTCNFLK